jgi:hypothetical protein
MAQTIHLRINNVNTLSACGKYINGEKQLSTDITKITCKKCKKRIELIWVIDLLYSDIKQISDQLNDSIDSIKKHMI